jgi:hypothetical protein
LPNKKAVEDARRSAEFEEKIAKFEAQAEVEAAEISKKFDVRALSESTRQVQKIVDPDLGEVRYMLLTEDDRKALHLDDVKSESEKTDLIIHAMLHKADPDLMYEDYKALPFDMKAAVTLLLGRTFSRFLRVQRRIGSQVAEKPKTAVS